MDLLQLKRGSLEQWIQVNPVLAMGEPGVIFDNSSGLPVAFVLGNGVTPFNELPLFKQATDLPEQYILPIATKEILGGIKSGSAGTGDKHEVEVGSDGIPFVRVPSAGNLDSYTKEESDNRYASKESISSIEDLAKQADIEAKDAQTAAGSAQNTANVASASAQSAQSTAETAQSLAKSNQSNLNNLSAVALRSNTLGQNKVVFTGIKILSDNLIFTTIDLVSGQVSELNFSELLTESVLWNVGIVTESVVGQRITAITDPISANVLGNTQDIGAIFEKISPQASSENRVLSKSEVETLISSNKGRQISLQNGSPFPTFSSLENGPWYFGSMQISTTAELISGDTATVLSDETQNGSTSSYQWNGEFWVFKSKTNASFTPEQEAALSSGITAEKISQIDKSIQENSSKITKEIADRAEAVNDAKAFATSNLENHNKSSAAHADIRSELANVRTIAEGRSKGESYNDISSMVSGLNSLPSGALSAGSNVYLLAKDVPDFWVYQVAFSSVQYSYSSDESFIEHFKENSTIQIGYYVIAILESNKIDLSGVQLKTLTETLQINSQNVTTVEGALKQLNILSTGAKTTSEEAKSMAESASSAAEQAKNKANEVDAKASTALSKSEEALSSASTAQAVASEALSKSEEAGDLANTAQSNAETAQSTAEDARNLAQTAINNASAAQTSANKANNDLSGFKTTVESKYAKKTDVATVQETVNSQASEIQNLREEDSGIKSRIQVLEAAQSAGMKREIVQSISNVTNPQENIIYCVPNLSLGQNIYDEYWLVGGKLELFGTTAVSLEGYVTDEDLANAINGIKHSVFFVKKTDISVSDISVITNYFNQNPGQEAALKQNDIFIVSTISDGVTYERSAYVYDTSDGDPGWVAITGNVDSSKVILKEDLVLAGKYTQIGNIKKDLTETITLETKGKSVLDVFKMFTTARVDPSVIKPSTDFMITAGSELSLEKGTSVVMGYSLTLNKGSYTYDPDTGVAAVSYSVSDGKTTKSTQTGSFSFVLTSSKTFTASISYTAGKTPVDNLGNPVPELAIPAGSTDVVSKTYTPFTASFIGFNPVWFKGDISTLNSSNIRNLGPVKKLEETYRATNAQYLVVAVPGNATSCEVINTSTGFPFGTANRVTVKVADATEIVSDSSDEYTVFYVSNATAASGTSTYKITIS